MSGSTTDRRELRRARAGVVLLVLGAALGQVYRQRRALARTREALADSRAAIAAARSDADRALDRVTRSCSEVGRELHDTVAGRLVAITLETDLALATELDPRVATLLRDVRLGAHDALSRIRVLIDRVEGRRPALTFAPRQALLDTVASASLIGVSVQVRDELAGRADPASAALYAAAQEAVVNMYRHAAPCRGEVRLSVREGTAVLVARNELPASPCRPHPGTGPSGGTGLAGLDRRLARVGGRMRSGIAGDGSWVVHAHAPLPDPTF